MTIQTVTYNGNKIGSIKSTNRSVSNTEMIKANLVKNYEANKAKSKYNRSRIFKRARYIMLNTCKDWSASLTQSWAEAKAFVAIQREELKQSLAKLSAFVSPKQFKDTAEFQLISLYKTLSK